MYLQHNDTYFRCDYCKNVYNKEKTGRLCTPDGKTYCSTACYEMRKMVGNGRTERHAYKFGRVSV